MSRFAAIQCCYTSLVEAHAGCGVTGTRAKVTKVHCVCWVGVASQTTQQTCCQLVTDWWACWWLPRLRGSYGETGI